jgi:hypothetical protein
VAGFALPLLLVLLVSGCTTTVQGIASPAPTEARADGTNSLEPALPGGARPSCARLIDDGCAAVALGDLFLEPDGLRCADLQALGYGTKDAVDYWFLWGTPPLMDADADGIPCETVFPDVERYLPAYY